MINTVDKNNHLSQQTIQTLKTGGLSEIELFHASSHLTGCESCANAFAESFCLNELETVPPGFAEEIQEKIYATGKNNRQFLFYSIRVSIAVCASLVIVFSGALNFIAAVDRKAADINPPNLDFVNTINSNLLQYSEKILKMEVLPNETKKK